MEARFMCRKTSGFSCHSLDPITPPRLHSVFIHLASTPPVPSWRRQSSLPPLTRFRTPRNRTSFGATWRELLGDTVRGISICTEGEKGDNAIRYIENLINPLASDPDGICVDERQTVFLLLPGECIERVQVAYRLSYGIQGLRLYTNKRVSQWFGECHHACAWLTPPSGYHISSLYGAAYDIDHSTRYARVGAVFAPLARLREIPKPISAYAKSTIIRCDEEPPVFAFESYAATPRAICLHVGSGVRDLRVLSAEQYGELMACNGPRGDADEQWLILADDERIEAVGIVIGTLGTIKNEIGVVTVCFRTNYRTTEWFGKQTADEVTWLDCAEHPGAFICGFQLEGYSFAMWAVVTGLGVVYNAEDGSLTEGLAVTDEASKAA